MALRLGIFLIALALSGSASAQTSVYRPFPDSLGVWNCSAVHPCIIWPTYYNFSFVLEGDTAIGNQVYKKVSIPYVHAYGNEICPFLFNTGFVFGLREDTLLKQVYISGQPEQLLYDFSLQVGDTVNSMVVNGCGIVSAIDSVLCNDGWRKRFIYTTDAGDKEIIEGIGSLEGLIFNLCITVNSRAATLNCFSNKSQAIYPFSAGFCAVVNVPEQNFIPTYLSFHPNPAFNQASVELRLENPEPDLRLLIYNARGTVVQCHFVGQAITRISTESLVSGIYFCRLVRSNSETVSSGKLVIR